ncbi:NOV [Symbiodinium necroappetens]|uniref:NOV protein n=1 Tax=Symbiodinium necroappetens TaxID=1628268 RepID=A0A813BNU5_9DINO|nr:NOV [Symbiodinium necroappetens]
MDKVNRLFVLFFAVYITIIVFAALRVITAVFLRDTLDAARNDDEALITERLRSKSKYLEKLEDVFEAIDSAHNGTISEKQLAEILAIPKAAAYFQTLDVDVLEGAALFRILDNGDGIITHAEFVDGILRCKGPARAMEQVAMRSELRQMDAKVTKLIRALERDPRAVHISRSSASMIGFRYPTACVEGFLTLIVRCTKDGPAIESLDALLACCERKPAEATAVCEPAISWEEFCAAEGLGGLSAARARRKAISSINRGLAQETEEADKAELQQRLAAEQEARTRERRELENSLESLEAQLATAQRRAEEAEAAARAAATAVTVAQDKEDGRQKALPQNSTCQPARPANGQQWQDPSASSEAVFVASLRRQRLVGEDGSRLAEDLPEHVREGVQRLSDSLCAAVERLANDLYESECHFLYEIVQNAEDAHARARPQDSTEPCLSLRLGAPCPSFPHGYFISENNEAGFTERDVTALCDISASSKKKPLPGAASGSIGCKGIGFKSVFTVSDRAHVLSKGFTFVFDVQGRLGKLGYVTPTWLTSSELATLPAEVQRGHAQGKTVLFLPLRSAGLASAISQEMDELASQGRASLLFLRRLRCIELLGQAASTPRLLRSGDRSASEMTPEPMEVRSCSVVIEQHEPAQEHQEHRYLVYRHLAPVASGSLQSMNAELVLAFPVLDEAETCSRCEPLFCSLPIRMVGFGFALHCDCFDLVANRSDLHRGSLPNQVVRDALPQAFARACQASPEISRRALTLLGEPVADPFWRVSREGILEQLSDVSCVQTSTGDFRRPCEVLLRGLGALRRASDLFPAALISLSCKKSLCESSDSSEERLLRRLGAEDFGARHIAACLAYKGGQWPEGFVAHAWADSSGTGRRIIAELYNVLGAVVRPADGSDAGAEAVALMLELPSLPLFPLLKETAAEPGRPDVHTPARLCDGAVFLGLCGELSERWQKVLATANGALRLLPLEISSALDGLGSQLLSSLGVEPPGAGRLAEAALEVLMKAVPGARPSPPAIYASWAALAVLRDLWAKGDDKGTAAVTNALTSLRVCESKEAAEALLTTKALGSLLVAPALCGALRPPPSLRCMSVLGVYRQLPSDLIERIEAFLGADCGEEGSLLACPSSRSLQPWPLEEGQDEAQRWLEALKWEAFFVDCLGAQPRRPADPAQERAAPFLSLEMGIKIGGDDVHSLWGCLLDEKATSEPVFRYACRRLTDATDRAWFSELPARATRRVRELFLHSEYWPVAGAALNGVYLRLALPTGRGSELRRCLAGLGARAQLDVPGLTAALEALLRGQCRLAETFARVYTVVDTLETTSGTGKSHSEQTEQLLRACIFHPEEERAVKAERCVWELPQNALVAQCCDLLVLGEVYKGHGEVQLKRYFAARGVPTAPDSAEAYVKIRQNLLLAAEELGKAWRSAEGEPELVQVPLPGSTKSGISKMRAGDFLAQIWEALLFVYRGMSVLGEAERHALQPFSEVEVAAVMPLPCPEGGPPQTSSMLEVARYHDGALFRKLSVCECFWEVAPDLADSPAAAWALSGVYPPELKNLFVESLGVREVVDGAALREGIMRRINYGKRSTTLRAGGFGTGREVDLRPGASVNELGLPEELLQGLGAAGSAPEASEGDAVAAAAEAVSLMRRLGFAQRAASDDEGQDGALVSPPLPARSVRCAALPGRRLRRAGEVRALCAASGRRCSVAIFESEPPSARFAALSAEGRYEASPRELEQLAGVLVNLANVFGLDTRCVAIVQGDNIGHGEKGDGMLVCWGARHRRTFPALVEALGTRAVQTLEFQYTDAEKLEAAVNDHARKEASAFSSFPEGWTVTRSQGGTGIVCARERRCSSVMPPPHCAAHDPDGRAGALRPPTPGVGNAGGAEALGVTARHARHAKEKKGNGTSSVLFEARLKCLSLKTCRTRQEPSARAWAFAALRIEDAELMHILAGKIFQKIRLCSCRDLASISWSFARLHLESPELLVTTSSAVHDRVAEFEVKGLSNAIWAFAVLSTQDEPVMFELAEAALQKIRQCRSERSAKIEDLATDLNGLTWAMERVSFLSDTFAATLLDFMQHLGRAKDAEMAGPHRPPPAKIESVGPEDHPGEDPLLRLDLPDMCCVHKPAGWEVDNEDAGGGPWMSSWLMQQFPFDSVPIVHYEEHQFGLVQRLDIPSSGLILAGKTWEGFYTLKFQLQTGLLVREYVQLVHGWVALDGRINEKSFAANASATTPAPGLLRVVAHLRRHSEGEEQKFSLVLLQILSQKLGIDPRAVAMADSQWTIKVKIVSMDNEAIHGKKGTKWKAGDDLTLQIEGHATVNMLKQRIALIVMAHPKFQAVSFNGSEPLDEVTKLQDIEGMASGKTMELVVAVPPEPEAPPVVLSDDEEVAMTVEEEPLPEQPAADLITKELGDAEADKQGELKSQAADALEDGDVKTAVAKFTEAMMLGGVSAMMVAKRAEMLLRLDFTAYSRSP